MGKDRKDSLLGLLAKEATLFIGGLVVMAFGGLAFFVLPILGLQMIVLGVLMAVLSLFFDIKVIERLMGERNQQ